MASSSRTLCSKCLKTLGHTVCFGCQQSLCTKHYIEHRQEINKQMEEVGEFHDRLHQQLVDEKSGAHPIVRQIDTWEKDSIERIRRWAEEARADFQSHFVKHKKTFQDFLEKLYKEMCDCRESEDYTDIEIKKWQKELQKLKNEFDNPSTIQLSHQGHTTTMIQPIQLRIFGMNKLRSILDVNTQWKPDGVTVAGGNSQGNALNQLNTPLGFDVDDDGTFFVADYYNHRIVVWKPGATTGEMFIGRHGAGSGIHQLHTPTNVIIDQVTDSLIVAEWGNKRVMRWSRQNPQQGEILVSNIQSYGLAMDDQGALYVCDSGGHEVRKYGPDDERGTVVAGGNGCGSGLNQFDSPYDIFIDVDGSLYVSDRNNHRVMKWRKDAKEGVVVAGDRRNGTHLTNLSYPSGIFVDDMGSVYVSESGNHRITRWLKGASEGSIIIGGTGAGGQSHQLNGPFIFRFDPEGALHVADRNNHRIQKFVVK